MEVPKNYKTLKVERFCPSGFLWAFEFLNYSNVTFNKKRLHVLEEHLTKKLMNKSGFEANISENEFVAVIRSDVKSVVRGYTTLMTNEKGGTTYEVIFIDYGTSAYPKVRDLRKLPDYASVEKLPAQCWRIGIYGVLPLHMQLEFGEPHCKKVGESWNGKDIHYIDKVLKNCDTIDFHEVTRYQQYRFGYIYLKDAKTQEITTLQKLLVDGGYAVEVDNFEKNIPSIVRRIKSSVDHVSFPTGDENNESTSINATAAPLENEPKTAEVPIPPSLKPTPAQSSELPLQELAPATTSSRLSSNSASAPPPKTGKGRGDLLKKFQIQKPPPLQPSAMVGRLPLNVMDQFDDTTESVYYDAVSSPCAEPPSPGSVKFQTPRKDFLSMSRRESSSSCEMVTPGHDDYSTSSDAVEITSVTPARDRSKIETVSLITPPYDCDAPSRTVSKDEFRTIDLTTPPPVSLITPSSSPISLCSSAESTSSLSRRGKGRGQLLAALLNTPQNDLSEKLSGLKLEETTVPPRGRASLLSRLVNDSIPITASTPAPVKSVKPSRVNFAKDIVELIPDTHLEEETETSNNELELTGAAAAAYDRMYSEQADFDDRLITKIMVLGNEGACRFKPKFAIKDFDLHPDVIERTTRLRLIDLRRSQRYMIPAMLTRRNVTLVDSSKSGKTVSCLIGLFSLLKNKKFYKALPVGPGPRAIILCPFSSQCESIDRQCKELNKSVNSSTVFADKDSLKVNVAYGCGKEAEKDKLRELTQGYDIVITTPSCLLRLLQTTEMMNLKRLCHLILDDADTLFSSYTEEVVEILQKAYSCAKKCDDGLVLPQRVIISTEWIPMIKNWVQKDVSEQGGVLMFGSYTEAAVFSNVKAVLRRIDDAERKKADLLNYLEVEAPMKSTVVVFNTPEEMNEIYQWLKSKCSRKLFKVGYSFGSVDEITAEWKRSSDKEEYPIMLSTDTFLHDLYIHEANSLIHYNLPVEERGYFTQRFSVLLNRLAGPPEFYSPGKMPLTFSKTDTLIYIGPNDGIQFPTIIKLMEKLKMKVPIELKNTAKVLADAREMEKTANTFCENYKKFGRCLNEKLCKFRHYFSPKYDQPIAHIPRQGFVKMQILQVYCASHYCVRLLEHRYGSNKWNEIESIVHPGVLNAKVNTYFTDLSKRSMHLCQKVGEVAAIETTTNMFKRVQVLDLEKDDSGEGWRSVKVKFIDDGKIDDVRPSVLVKLSEELAAIPATTVDVFLCNVLPVDRDIEWGDIINQKVKERIECMQDSEDVLFIGEIKLVTGSDVWINPLQCHKMYDKGKDVIVVMSSMCKELIKKGVAVENPDHLPKLLSMYESAGLPHLPETDNKPLIKPPPVLNVPLAPTTGEPENPPSEPEAMLSESDDPIEPDEESSSTKCATASSELETPLDVINQSNHTANDSNDGYNESEEEWILEDVPQTPAAPKTDASDPEEDLYAYEIDDMRIEGLDEKFDAYFGPGTLEDFINDLKSNVPIFKDAFAAIEPKTKEVERPKKQPLSITEVTDSHITKQPTVVPGPIDMTSGSFKPNVTWYQDPEFVYMSISLNVDDYTVRIESDRIYFRATYNERIYEFDEVLFTMIDERASKSYKSSVMITIKLEKVIKQNKWPRIFKNKSSMGWIKKSVEHLDEDITIPDMCWQQKLNTGLAIKQVEIPQDFKYISNYSNKNFVIYPEGYEENYLRDSDEDSDGVGNDGEE